MPFRKWIAVSCVVMIVTPGLAHGAESIFPGACPSRPGVFFDESTATRLLQEVEECRVCDNVVEAQSELISNLEIDAKMRDQIEKAMKDRIDEMGKEREEARKVCDAAISQIRDAQKAGAPSWFDRTLKALGYIGAGLIVGYVAGAVQ